MASNTQEFKTVVSLNAKQAQDELLKLKKQVEDLKKKKDDALKGNGSWSKEESINLRQAKAAAKAYESTVSKTISTLSNMGTASVGEVRDAVKQLKKLMNDTTDPKDYQKLEEFLEQCKFRISGMTDATKLTAKEMRELMNNSQLVAKVLGNINTSSLKDLTTARDAIQKSMNNADPSSWKYKSQEENLKKVQNRIAQIKAEQQQINSLVDQYDIELRNCQKSSAEINKESQMIGQTMNNLTKSSIRELEMAKDLVEQRLKYTRQDSEEFKTLTHQAKQLNNQLEIVNNKSKDTRGIWSKISGFFNTNWGFFTQAIGALTGLTVTIRKATTAYAEMEDTMANVRKYTNQTDEQVRLMNEDFKKMNTRTSREQLNELAGAAGRLGKQSKKDIEDFVEAADKINVALGDDLGKGAVDKIGKLANVFGEEGRLGLKQAMLSTGSAINELAQSSSANAGYIVDFTADLAGVGRQAGMTQAQIMGLASALDQNMQEEATASTVFSQLITKMYQDPAKFANIAGIEVQKFTKLLKENANGALLEFMQSMQNKGGFAEMAPMFESMNLDGTRAVGVLSSVATHLDQVRAAQNTATKAYEAGTSVLNEFNTNNSTVNAELDKAKKKFNDLTIELGQKLMPVASMAVTSGSLLIKTLEGIMSFVVRFRSTLALLTIAITILTIAKEKDLIVTKLIALWNEKLVPGFKNLWKIIKTNPYAALALVAVTVVGVIIDLTRKTDALTQAEKNLTKIRNDAMVNMQEEKSKIDLLVKAAKNDKLSMDDRQKAIKELNNIIPGYNAKLDAETKRYRANEKALKDYNKQLQRKYELEGAKDMLRQLGKQKAEAQIAVDQAQKALENALNAGNGMTYTTSWGIVGNTTQDLVDQARRRLNSAKLELESVKTQINAITDSYGNELQKDAVKGSGGNNRPDPDAGGGGNSYVDPKQQKKIEAERKKREAEEKRRAAAALKAKKAEDKQIEAETDLHLAKLLNSYALNEISREDFIKQREKIEKEGLDKRMKIWDKESSEYKDLQTKEEDATREKVEAIDKLRKRNVESDYKKEEQKIYLEYTTKGSSLYMDEDARDERLFYNQQDYIKKRIVLAKIGSEEWFDLRDELEENDNQHRIQREQKHQERLNQYREQFGRQDLATQEKLAIDGLDKIAKIELAKYKDGTEEKLKAEKEFQVMRQQLVLYYAEQRSEQNLYNSKGEQFKRNADTAYKTASNNAKADYENDHPTGTGVGDYYTSDVTIYASTLANIKKMEQQGVVSHQEAMAAMSQATAEMCQGMAAKMQAAYDDISPIMSAMSSYYSAQSDYEVTVTEKKYDKMIEKAGNNSAKSKKLEEKKQKEIAKIKTKYNRKQVKIQIAQAIAQTAVAALNAYASAAAIPVVGHVLAPIAAGIATAAGMIQVATIKKQAQAQEAGYYEGGFTGGSRYRREAGVVHEGEFVANHNAVNNPQLLPAFRLIDVAQRHNTVGRLTAADVSRAMGTGGATVVSAPTVNVQTDNSELAGTLQQARDTIDRLSTMLANGDINVRMPDWDDFDRSRSHWDKIKGNK